MHFHFVAKSHEHHVMLRSSIRQKAWN